MEWRVEDGFGPAGMLPARPEVKRRGYSRGGKAHGAAGLRTRSWRGHAGRVLDTVQNFTAIACRRCGFIHVVPLPTCRELERAYRPNYYGKEKPDFIDRQRRDREWWEVVYRERYEMLERLLPASRRRILDIGCGPGFFLAHGRERGWSGLGFEPARQAAEHARSVGLEVIEAFFRPGATRGIGRFDVVYLHEVLEHVANPAGVLKLARRLLAPGGILFVCVPNDYNPLQRLLRLQLGYPPWWLSPPHHLNYFSLRSLSRLIERCGFSVEHKSVTFPMEAFLLMGADYVGNDFVGRRAHGMRKALEISLARAKASSWLAEFYSWLGERGLGRECVVVARKRDRFGEKKRHNRIGR